MHAPDTNTLIGQRDHALLFTYFITACRSSAIASTTVGSLDRTDTDWYINVVEKGSKERRMPLLDAAAAILAWLDSAGISLDDDAAPLFPAFETNRKTPTRRHLTSRAVLNMIKKYAAAIGLKNVSPSDRRGICTHSLRKTAGKAALKNGAPAHQVQSLFGHADIRTTQGYIDYAEEDIEEAARRIHIR